MIHYAFKEATQERLMLLSKLSDPHSLALLKQAGLAPGMRVLDIGCGTGNVTQIAGDIVGSTGHATGIDIDPERIQQNRQRIVEPHITFKSLDFASYQPSELYDMVYNRYLLAHLPDPQDAITRMIKLTKPGGKIVVEDVDMSSLHSSPPSEVVERLRRLMQATVRASSNSDPDIGPRLETLMRNAGVSNMRGSYYDIHDDSPHTDIKRLYQLALEALRKTALEKGVCAKDEFTSLKNDFAAFIARPETRISFKTYQVAGEAKYRTIDPRSSSESLVR